MLQSPAYCRPLAFDAFAERLATIDEEMGLFCSAWAIALHEHPDVEIASGVGIIDKLVATVRKRAASADREALMAHLHDVLFDVVQLQGDVEDYYNPANSYLPEVLRRRKGLPITLTLIYKSAADQLGIQVYGVNSPGHFLAEVTAPHDGASRMYVDPFYGGGLLSKKEAVQRISEATGGRIPASADLLQRATPRQWLFRMLNNLQAAFAAAGRERDLLAMQELQQLLTQQRP